MSLSWRKRLRIGLAPDAVEYALDSPGRSRQPVTDQVRIVDGSGGPERWRGAMAALADTLGRIAVRKADCHVVLSNHFLRCQLLPWNDGFKGRREYAALAQAKFRAIHGVVAESWDVRLGRLRYGAPVLACAVDTALIGELEAVILRSGNRPASIQPHFSATFDRHHAQCKDDAWWFASVEPGRLWLGRVAGGAWQSISSRVLGSNPVDETLQALAQEMATSDVAAEGKREPVHAIVTGLQREQMKALREAGLRILGFAAGRHFDLGGALPENA